MLDGYTVIILIERVGWADLGTSNSCKDKLPHGTAQAGAWRLNGVFMTPGFGTCCGALLGVMLGPALEVQCAWWVPIFPLLLLLLFLVAEMTLQLTGTVAKYFPCEWRQKQPHASPHLLPLLSWVHCSHLFVSGSFLVPTMA